MKLPKSHKSIIDSIREGWTLLYRNDGPSLEKDGANKPASIAATYSLYSSGFIDEVYRRGETRYYAMTEKGKATLPK